MGSSNNGSALTTSPARSTISMTTAIGANVANDEFHFPADLISVQDRKDDALRVLKSDLMTALNKEVKSLDEDSWMFEGPRSRIHLISRPGGLQKKMEIRRNFNLDPPK